MKRRDFITLLGRAAAGWPLAARAQQPAMPVIGHLFGGPAGARAAPFAFTQGLKEAGFVEGQNVSIEYRWSEGHNARLPGLANELVGRKVDAIYAAGGATVALAAKAATMTIPIVFSVGDDPVHAGLVTSLSRPGGNVTGVTFMNSELTGKRFELLQDLSPSAKRFALLVNQGNQRATEVVTTDARAITSAAGRSLDILSADSNVEIDAAFAEMLRNRCEALLIGPSPVFVARRAQIATLAARHAIPAIHFVREFVEAGGLMSYGSSIAEANRQAGIYVGRVLKGEKPADLPVQQAAKFTFVFNLQTAKALGLDVPPTLLARADEVIE